MSRIPFYIIALFISLSRGYNQHPGPIICMTDERSFEETGASLVNKYCDQIIGEPIRINIKNWNILSQSADNEIPSTMMTSEIARLMSLFQNSRINVKRIVRLQLYDIPTSQSGRADQFVDSGLFKALVGEIENLKISGIAIYLSHDMDLTRLGDCLRSLTSLKQAGLINHLLIRLSPGEKINEQIKELYDKYIDGYLDYKTLGGAFSGGYEEEFLVPNSDSPLEDISKREKTFPHVLLRLYLLQTKGKAIAKSWKQDKDLLCNYIPDNDMRWTISASFYDALVGKNETNIILLDTLKSLETLTKFLKNNHFGGLTLKVSRDDFFLIESCPLNYTGMLQVAHDTWHGIAVDSIIKQEEKDVQNLFISVKNQMKKKNHPHDNVGDQRSPFDVYDPEIVFGHSFDNPRESKIFGKPITSPHQPGSESPNDPHNYKGGLRPPFNTYDPEGTFGYPSDNPRESKIFGKPISSHLQPISENPNHPHDYRGGARPSFKPYDPEAPLGIFADNPRESKIFGKPISSHPKPGSESPHDPHNNEGVASSPINAYDPEGTFGYPSDNPRESIIFGKPISSQPQPGSMNPNHPHDYRGGVRPSFNTREPEAPLGFSSGNPRESIIFGKPISSHP